MYLRLAPYSQEWLCTSDPLAFSSQVLDSGHLFPRCVCVCVVLGTEPSDSWVLDKRSANWATSQWKPDPASASYRLCDLEGVTFCHLGNEYDSNNSSSQGFIGI